MDGNNGKQQGGSNNNSKQSGLSWSQPPSASKSTPLSSIKPTPMLKPAPAAAMPANGSRRTGLLFASGVVVGGLLAWSLFSVTSDNKVAEVTDTTPAPAGQMAATGSTSSGTLLPGSVVSSEALVVPSPQDAGLSVAVSSANVSAPTWVVVYESKNGVRGNALGAALFFPGGQTKTVNLLRATTAGQSYLVGRHVDNGDKQFSLTLDQAVVNGAGQPMYTEFRTR